MLALLAANDDAADDAAMLAAHDVMESAECADAGVETGGGMAERPCANARPNNNATDVNIIRKPYGWQQEPHHQPLSNRRNRADVSLSIGFPTAERSCDIKAVIQVTDRNVASTSLWQRSVS